MPERLRTLRHCIFTGGVVEENGSCRAAFCESAARRGIKLPQSPTATAPSEMGPLAKPETFPPCQRLPPRGSWQNRQVLTEGVQSPTGCIQTDILICCVSRPLIYQLGEIRTFFALLICQFRLGSYSTEGGESGKRREQRVAAEHKKLQAER